MASGPVIDARRPRLNGTSTLVAAAVVPTPAKMVSRRRCLRFLKRVTTAKRHTPPPIVERVRAAPAQAATASRPTPPPMRSVSRASMARRVSR